jgi:hypothetical protein
MPLSQTVLALISGVDETVWDEESILFVVYVLTSRLEHLTPIYLHTGSVLVHIIHCYKELLQGRG